MNPYPAFVNFAFAPAFIILIRCCSFICIVVQLAQLPCIFTSFKGGGSHANMMRSDSITSEVVAFYCLPQAHISYIN